MVNMVFGKFDIEDLASGNYEVVVQVMNTQNVMISEKRLFFQRSSQVKEFKDVGDLQKINVENTFVSNLSDEELLKVLYTMKPLANNAERKFIESASKKRGADLSYLKPFFYNFWKNRDQMDPVAAYNRHINLVQFANDNFAAPHIVGYATDRGQILLEYGMPDSMVDDANQAGGKPFSLWHYYALKDGQRNVQFYFENKNLIADDYELVSSTARGELGNVRYHSGDNNIQDGMGNSSNSLLNESGRIGTSGINNSTGTSDFE